MPNPTTKSKAVEYGFTNCIFEDATPAPTSPFRQRRSGARYRPIMCSDCGRYPAELPNKLCPGCEAYKEHRS